MITEEMVLDFAASSFSSVWSLELLLVLKRNPDRCWDADELIRELRSSRVVVGSALENLVGAGLVVNHEGGRYQYRASPGRIEEFLHELQKIYDTKPTSVVRAIVSTSNRKLKLLSDAFRLIE